MIDKKNRTILMILGVLTIIITMVGATFAYFKAISQSEPQILTTTSLNINIGIKGSLHVKDISPTTWSNNMNDNTNNKNVAVIPFVVSGDSKIKANYGVTMTTIISPNNELEGGKVSDIKYVLYRNGNYLTRGDFSETFKERIVDDGKITLNGNLKDEYVLYVYIEKTNEPQNSLQEIDFTINLMSDANQVE